MEEQINNEIKPQETTVLQLTKVCKKCNTEKPQSDFRKQLSNRDGLKNVCKICDSAYQKQRYLNQKEKYVIKVMRWQKKNVKKMKEYRKKFYYKNKTDNKDKNNGNPTDSSCSINSNNI